MIIEAILRDLGFRDTNVSRNNRLIGAGFLSEEDVARARAEIAKWRKKLDKKTGADKVKKENV